MNHCEESLSMLVLQDIIITLLFLLNCCIFSMRWFLVDFTRLLGKFSGSILVLIDMIEEIDSTQINGGVF